MTAKHIALGLCTLLALGGPCRAAPLVLALELGATSGLDRVLRGGACTAELGFVFGKPGEEVGAGLRLGLLVDASLAAPGAAGAAIGQAELRLLIGGDLALSAGLELPLNGLVLSDPPSGLYARLEPLALPSRFAMEAVLLELAGRQGRPKLALIGELSWSAYRRKKEGSAATAEPAAAKTTKSQDGIAGILGFEAGFRGFIGLRLRWGG